MAEVAAPAREASGRAASTLIALPTLSSHAGHRHRQQQRRRARSRAGCGGRGTGHGAGTRPRPPRSAAVAPSTRRPRCGTAGIGAASGYASTRMRTNMASSAIVPCRERRPRPGCTAHHPRTSVNGMREEAPGLVEVGVEDRVAAPSGRGRPGPSRPARSPVACRTRRARRGRTRRRTAPAAAPPAAPAPARWRGRTTTRRRRTRSRSGTSTATSAASG